MSSGDFIVVKSPNYVRFVHEASPIETSEIDSVISASLGLPIEKDLKWNGLEEINLFRRPKATAVISVSGVPSGRLDAVQGIATYKTVESESRLDTSDVVRTIENMDWKVDPLTVDFSFDGNSYSISSRRSELFAGLQMSLPQLRDDVTSGYIEKWFSPSELASLNVNIDSDLAFLGELYLIQQTVNTIADSKATLKTHSPDFFHFSVGGLEGLALSYGVDSVQFADALKLLQTAVTRITDKLQSVYGENIVIELVTFTPEAASKPQSRHVRSLKAASDAGVSKSTLKLAPAFTDQYSAIFNICLWTMIVFAIAVFYIAWAIWFMDPGRDSIIYRMTSTRTKRD